MNQSNSLLKHDDCFIRRHIGPQSKEQIEMLQLLGFSDVGSLIDVTVPRQIRVEKPLALSPGQSEFELLQNLKTIALENQIFRSFIGMGYSDCITPPVIQRNILENPGWYTQYTPYQAEISQGRLEALLNFQTMILELTGLQIANASLLDEGTAAAEAMTLCFTARGNGSVLSFFVSELCHPQTIAILRTRAEPLGIQLIIGNHEKFDFSTPIFGALLQYPDTCGTVHEYQAFIEKVHQAGALAVVAADLLALALLTPPGEFGADVAVGTTQRFGIPLGFGGPHAAYFATREEFKRQVPGRIVGVSKDVDGKSAIRLALQTREQHIRRDKATSNICTAQVLLAVMASMYAVYHGPQGIRRIAEQIHLKTRVLEKGLRKLGYPLKNGSYFDTLWIEVGGEIRSRVISEARSRRINLRSFELNSIGVSLDETVSVKDLENLLGAFAAAKCKKVDFTVDDLAQGLKIEFPEKLQRRSQCLTHPVFNSYHSETEMLRYMRRLEAKDLSLTSSMIPLGSCTMKLNATAELYPVSWPEFARIHPFAPDEQTRGYQTLLAQLEKMLGEITGFEGVSLQPNAGSQGEYAGLLAIRNYHLSRGQCQRDVCLIPKSAHGTNPASAAMVGMRIIVVDCDSSGNIDVNDLKSKAEEHRDRLSSLMVTYPSTHGVFEESIMEICEIIHRNGGQVYLDGANMNAQVGLCRPGDYGADVCHLNLHKTFAIPHGGGGPGMAPICVKSHLVPFLPAHALKKSESPFDTGPVSAAPYGSASVLLISWMYISLMGGEGLKHASEIAILNANYIAKKLSPFYPVLYRGREGTVAHECIFDLRPLKDKTGIEVEDVAKRLMDYGFHAPTISFPVPGTLMVEPTESESKVELDRFCDAMIAIRAEIQEIEEGKSDRMNNLLKNAPHTAEQVTQSEWLRPYTRERAAYPMPSIRQAKFWPSVGRINNVLGDRNLICACPPIENYT